MKLSTRIIAAVLLVVGSSGAVYAFSKHSDWGMTTEEKIEFISDRVTRKRSFSGLSIRVPVFPQPKFPG